MRTAPISKLQKEYKKVMQQVANGEPVTLTKNGENYLVMITTSDYEDYMKIKEQIRDQKVKAYDEVMKKLEAGAASIKEDGGLTTEQVKERLGLVK